MSEFTPSPYWRIFSLQKELPTGPHVPRGIGAHNFLAIVNPQGDITQEMHGLPSLDWTLFLTRPGNYLRVEMFVPHSYINEAETLSAYPIQNFTTEKQAKAALTLAFNVVASALNAHHDLYQGASILGDSYNSNSVWNTAMRALGIENPMTYTGPVRTPGNETDLRTAPTNNEYLNTTQDPWTENTHADVIYRQSRNEYTPSEDKKLDLVSTGSSDLKTYPEVWARTRVHQVRRQSDEVDIKTVSNKSNKNDSLKSEAELIYPLGNLEPTYGNEFNPISMFSGFLPDSDIVQTWSFAALSESLTKAQSPANRLPEITSDNEAARVHLFFLGDYQDLIKGSAQFDQSSFSSPDALSAEDFGAISAASRLPDVFDDLGLATDPRAPTFQDSSFLGEASVTSVAPPLRNTGLSARVLPFTSSSMDKVTEQSSSATPLVSGTPGTLATDDMTLDRIVRGYIDRACSGSASGSRRPDPTLRLMPGGSRGY